MGNRKLSTTFKLLRALGFNYSEEEYGDVSLWRVISRFFGNIYRKRLEKMMDWPILQSFNPRTEWEKFVLAALFKVNPDYLSVNPDAGAVDQSVIESIRQVAAASDARTFRDNLTQNGFTLFKFEGEYYILNFKTNAIVNARDGGVGEGLLEHPGETRAEGDSRTESGGLLNGVGLDLDGLVPDHPVENVANTLDNILSMGGTGSGGVGGGGGKDLSKKRKKRKDDRDGGGRGY